jgi:hypothetical protein
MPMPIPIPPSASGIMSSVRVYLDLCCLKRPFDSQAHPVVRLETEAVLALLGAPVERMTLIRSAVHALENSYNTVKTRREAVADWISRGPLVPVKVPELRPRTEFLVSLGLSKFDGLHLATAELSSASVFVTVDYPLLNRLRRNESALKVRASDPVRLVEEVFGGAVDYQPQ